MNKKTSILVVDDVPVILQAYSEILRSQGYEVWEASTGQEGLQTARERHPDLVLLDVMLPDLSGIEVCRQIKADAALTDVFVVLVSGKATDVAYKVAGLESGADDYLAKPLEADEFRARVRTILRLRNTTAALRASEQRHRQLVEMLPEAVGMIDLQGRLLAVNPQGVEMLGYANPEELLGRSVFDLTRPEDHERIKADITTTLETGTLRNAEYVLLRKTGDPFPAELSAALAAVADDQPSGIVLVARDTSQRKRAEEALQDQTRYLANMAQFLGTLMEAIPAPVFYKDMAGRYLGCNRAFEKNLGVSREQIIGKTVYEVAPKDLAEVYHQADEELLKQPGGQTYESSLLYADGTRHQVIFNKATYQDAEGEVGGLIGIILDITERKRAEEQIQLLADAVQSTQDMICITDQENRFTFANRAFLQTYGYTAEEIMGRTPDFLCSAKNPPELTDVIFQQTLRDGWKGQILDRRKDGTEFPISLDTSPIKSSEGRTLGLVAVARDITERIRAEKRNAAFSHLGYRLSAASTREQAVQIIMDIASELFGWDAGYVHLYSESDDQLIPVMTVDTVDGQRTPVQPTSFTLDPSPLMRLIMKAGAQLINPDHEAALDVHLVSFGDATRRSASKMYVPIRARGAIIGILSVQSYTPGAYSPEDLKLLQTLADHCGDTLQRIEMGDSLREAEAKYRSIVENATEGIFQTTPDGRFRSANPALAHIMGYATREELMAEVTDLEGQLYVRPEKRQEFKRLLETQDSVRAFEFEHYRKDGSIIWVSINAHVVRHTSGNLQYYEGTIQDITKRKSAEEALQMSQILQAALLDNIPDPAWLKDAEGRFLACNEPLARFFGQPRQAIVGRTLFDLDPQGAARLTVEDKEVMQAGKPSRFEWHRTDPQGRVGWFETIKSPLLGERGNVTGTVGIARDITERKWVENLLRLQRDIGIFLSSIDDLGAAAARLLKFALENEGLDSGGVYLVNSQTNELELVAHQGLSADFAKRSSRFTATPLQNRLAGAGQAAARPQVGPIAWILEQLQREGLLDLEAIPIQHNGQVIAVLNVGSRGHGAIPAKTRQVIEALAAQAGGALARIRAEQSARTNRQLLEKTFGSIRAAVFIIDATATCVQDCNPSATRVFGYAREEMIGRSPALLHLDEATLKQFRGHLEAAVNKKEPVSEFELCMQRKDGTSFPTEHSVAPIWSEAGWIVSWVDLVRDNTERKRIEEDLRQLSGRIIEAQEAERQRVARELHDSVNQVIASAKMRLRKVEAFVALNPAARELLARCDELLVQALEENRRIAHDLRPTDLDELGLADACRNFCRQFQARTNLVVKTRLAQSTQRCPPATELNLFRIMQEALNNVEKHARARTIRVQIAFQRRGLMLRIQDDGRGFDPAASKAAKRRGEGIGLTNMRERAAILGGTCEVESVPNEGTTITVRAPCQAH
jgi:PAS domain S-box-containing protein